MERPLCPAHSCNGSPEEKELIAARWSGKFWIEFSARISNCLCCTYMYLHRCTTVPARACMPVKCLQVGCMLSQ